MHKMESSLGQTPLENSLFSPSKAKTLKVKGESGFSDGSVCYNEKHNLIIACPLNSTIQFYDATTLLPVKGRETQKLEGSVMQMSFCSEAETYLLGCPSGFIYEYNVARNQLKKLKKYQEQVLAVAFLNKNFYAFSLFGSNKLYIGNFNNDNVIRFGSNKSDAVSLKSLAKRNLLFSGLMDGSLMIHRTNKLPSLKIFGVIQAHKAGQMVLTVQNININGKEFMVTASSDLTAKIWCLVKGRMRLLRVIRTEEICYSLVYLENFKMIAITEKSKYIKFFSVSSGKLEKMFCVNEDATHCLFWMKEKNMIGVTSYHKDLIDFVQVKKQEK